MNDNVASPATSLADIRVTLLNGAEQSFGDLAPSAALIVNVASKCGFAPQYEGLEALYEEFAPSGLSVVGVPCNQFMHQEPGTAEEIGEFCKLNYGVTFPLLEKSKVNGKNAHPLFRTLKRAKDGAGIAGPVLWNFEKFVVWPANETADNAEPRKIERFRSATTPDDPALRKAIEAALAA